MLDLGHLNALESSRVRAIGYLAAAKTKNEIFFREHDLRMISKEIEGERAFLGLELEDDSALDGVSDADLLSLLGV